MHYFHTEQTYYLLTLCNVIDHNETRNSILTRECFLRFQWYTNTLECIQYSKKS